jgi:hypothetical protein
MQNFLVVAHVVAIEPVSLPSFPANREINREFRQICSSLPFALENQTMIARA